MVIAKGAFNDKYSNNATCIDFLYRVLVINIEELFLNLQVVFEIACVH